MLALQARAINSVEPAAERVFGIERLVHHCLHRIAEAFVGEGFDVAIRVGYLPDSNLIARRISPIYGKLLASPEYIKKYGAPNTPEELLNHEALMQGTETWRLLDGGKVITVHPQGRFKADNGEALLAAAVAGLGVAALPDLMIEPHIAAGVLTPVLRDHPPPEAGLFVVRPPGDIPPRKFKVLTEILLEHFTDKQ